MELKHFNPYHDPETGQFDEAPGGSSSSSKGSFFKPGHKGKNSPAQETARAAEDTVRALKSLERNTRKKKRYDFSNMTDAELRQTINRMNMEKQYTDLKNEELSRGRQSAHDTLELIGDLAAISSSVALVGTALYRTKHPGN